MVVVVVMEGGGANELLIEEEVIMEVKVDGPLLAESFQTIAGSKGKGEFSAALGYISDFGCYENDKTVKKIIVAAMIPALFLSVNNGIHFGNVLLLADPITSCYRGDPITSSLGLRVINALQLGYRSKASDMISEVGAVSHESNVEHIVRILEYCARSPDPLVSIPIFEII
ncbi:hypothetical protein RDABS01_011442 [Bienertia sinuspersici]